MQRDKFLIEQIKLDDGYVPLTVMLNFKILASISSNASTILKSLEDSELMEISEDQTKIRRSPKFPLPEYNEEYKKAQEERTAYVKGFPLTSDLDLVKNFLEPYQPFENIIVCVHNLCCIFPFDLFLNVQFIIPDEKVQRS